jgi:hypothetical protein
MELAPYAGSPRRVIHKMLDLAKPQYGELLVDIGSGKGNIVVEAALKHPTMKCLGYEINPDSVRDSRDRVRANGLENRVEIVEGSIFDYGLEEADIVSAYLSTRGMNAIEDKVFSELGINARLVSHDYGFEKHSPNKLRTVSARSAFTPWLPFPVLHYVEIYWMNDINIRKSLQEMIRDFLKKK